MGFRINHALKNDRKIGDNLKFVGFNVNGNLVYVLKNPGKPELYFVIDLDTRDIYDICFEDAAERLQNPEFKKEQSEIRAKYMAPKMLSPDEAIKALSRNLQIP